MAFFDEFQRLKIQLEEIIFATENFADNKVIGVGGFGKVYKGEICHSKGKGMAAFKRLDSRLGQGNSEFWKEIVMLSRYSHENLVSLLGYCDEGGEKILVYEYASRGSLDRHLSSTTLTWIKRIKICVGVARALRYLHDPDGNQQRVIHRDIKTANILLDEKWNAKVSDLGLSKMGPANQQHTALISNVAGTFGYLDPLYLEMGLLTKESDVYSFGVVLFEALCGRLCFEYKNGQYHSLVRMWKKSYEEKKLEDIIPQDRMRKMHPRSLDAFSHIAYLCLQESREERPPMPQVVEKLKIAYQFQMMYELMVVPKEYKAIFNASVTPLVFRSEEELKTLLCKGILVDTGKTWFSLNEDGKNCELISAIECIKASPDEYTSDENSRFTEGCYQVKEATVFNAHLRARFLTPGITYTVNLVFKFFIPWIRQCEHTYVRFKHQLVGETESSSPYVAYWRENGWMMSELYQFTSDGTNFDLDIRFEFNDYDTQGRMVVEGIEFRPLSHVDHEVLNPTLNVDQEQKLPNDYKKIIKWSKDRNKWTTKKEFYHLFCQGFLINTWNGFLSNYGEEWFSLAKNGKKCSMLSARAILKKSEWSWKPLSTSRFKEVAYNCHVSYISVIVKIRSIILSPMTSYACYLVYEITTKSHPDFVRPLGVLGSYLQDHSRRNHYLHYSSDIYLVSPQSRVISPKDDENTHKPSDIPKLKGLPQRRNNDWMEVQICEFQSDATPKRISMHFSLGILKDFHELVVQGIELRPL